MSVEHPHFSPPLSILLSLVFYIFRSKHGQKLLGSVLFSVLPEFKVFVLIGKQTNFFFMGLFVLKKQC